MKFIYTALLFLLFCVSAHANEEDIQPENVDSVTILASSSMTVAISEISRIYSRSNAVDVNAVFEATSELLRKIEDGDPADIVITASDKWMQKMEERGLIDASSHVTLAKNRLALVAAKGFEISQSKNLEENLDYIHNRALMVMADPATVTLGEITEKVLMNVKRWRKLRKFMVFAPTSSKTVDLIIKSQTAGVIYATDALLYKNSLQYIGDIPARLHKPIYYHAAVVVGSNMEESRKYLDYLTSEPAKDVFRKHGFVVE
ncbi:MAG: molybdate ABC transporter substrate-binding protein [Alphaproteobacteria bacterium CG11_big_fil_rev_8_21_14_0_20_44_7]|nr:MAG: molybdate ABC transporter substrate-binding protein [Alphaproteobacteria bacterium CG11_big_fil_rev_8_21_14_0_20_44_7]